MIKPALTPDQWAQYGCIGASSVMHARDGVDVKNGHGCIDIGNPSDPESGVLVEPEYRHALAALCLHEQEFGFTHQDVQEVRHAANSIESEYCDPGHDQLILYLRGLASRIAALLPPQP